MLSGGVWRSSRRKVKCANFLCQFSCQILARQKIISTKKPHRPRADNHSQTAEKLEPGPHGDSARAEKLNVEFRGDGLVEDSGDRIQGARRVRVLVQIVGVEEVARVEGQAEGDYLRFYYGVI